LGFEDAFIEARLHALWDELNQCVHPSPELVHRLCDDSALLIRNAFDEQWALQTLETSYAVFALVWLVILKCFPKAIGGIAANLAAFKACPYIGAMLGPTGHIT
jgi:hypothetical protein